nr:37s ribosomal protein s24, mitochondrial [Quercus suber]
MEMSMPHHTLHQIIVMAAPCKRICHRAARQTKCAFSTPSVCAGRIRSYSSASPRHQAGSTAQASRPDNDNPFSDAGLGEPAYETDDLSSLAHSELQAHRELRQMLRTAAWEMPLLSQLAASRPFTPVSRATQPLKWRYTTYMGETHPAAHKVVVEFDVRDLPLTDAQRHTFTHLVGARCNPATHIVRMSHEGFPSQAQNKRYLADLIQTLLREAQDPKADSFADVPIDTRHHRPTAASANALRFPEEWLMTPERKEELEARRREELLEEGRRVEQSRIVSGLAAIDFARQQQQQKQAQEHQDRLEQRVPVGRATPRGRR